MGDLRAMANDMLATADEIERLRAGRDAAERLVESLMGQLEDAAKVINRLTVEKANQYLELDHERQQAKLVTIVRNQYRQELDRVARILLQEGATPDQIEADGIDVVLVQALDNARRAVAR